MATTSELKFYLSQFGNSHHCRARNNQIHDNQSIRGDYKMKSGRIYLQVVTRWVWLWAQSPRTNSNHSLTGNRTSVQHQLRSLIDLGPVTAGNPSSSQIVITIVWLRAQIAIFFAIFAQHIANSPLCGRPSTLDQAVYIYSAFFKLWYKCSLSDWFNY